MSNKIRCDRCRRWKDADTAQVITGQDFCEFCAPLEIEEREALGVGEIPKPDPSAFWQEAQP